MAWAVRSLSPVSMTTSMPISRQAGHRPGAVRLDGVGHGDHAQQGPVPWQRAGASCPACGQRPPPAAGTESSDTPASSDMKRRLPPSRSGHPARPVRPVAGQGGEVRPLRRRGRPAGRPLARMAAGQGVLRCGPSRQAGQHAAAPSSVTPGAGQKVGHLGLPGGDGAGLVQGHHVDLPGLSPGRRRS